MPTQKTQGVIGMTEQTYTVKQLAQLLNVCDTTVRRWIDVGKVRAYKLTEGRGHWRVTKEEVERLTGAVAHGVHNG